MAVYVDDARIKMTVEDRWRDRPDTEPERTRRKTHRGVWSHLFADTPAELDAFAERLGLNPRWLQNKPAGFVHYDVVESRRQAAIKLGAVPVSWLDVPRILRDAGGNLGRSLTNDLTSG